MTTTCSIRPRAAAWWRATPTMVRDALATPARAVSASTAGPGAAPLASMHPPVRHHPVLSCVQVWSLGTCHPFTSLPMWWSPAGSAPPGAPAAACRMLACCASPCSLRPGTRLPALHCHHAPRPLETRPANQEPGEPLAQWQEASAARGVAARADSAVTAGQGVLRACLPKCAFACTFSLAACSSTRATIIGT